MTRVEARPAASGADYQRIGGLIERGAEGLILGCTEIMLQITQ
ncbi:MAG: hypothetical protein ACRDGS_04350 [Chloroflexota bacterium]